MGAILQKVSQHTTLFSMLQQHALHISFASAVRSALMSMAWVVEGGIVEGRIVTVTLQTSGYAEARILQVG